MSAKKREQLISAQIIQENEWFSRHIFKFLHDIPSYISTTSILTINNTATHQFMYSVSFYYWSA